MGDEFFLWMAILYWTIFTVMAIDDLRAYLLLRSMRSTERDPGDDEEVVQPVETNATGIQKRD